MILDRSKAPASNQIGRPNFPNFRVLDRDGLLITTYVRDKQPILFLELVFDAGKVTESISEQSYFAGKMIAEGCKGYSSQEIAEFLDHYGSHLEITPALDETSIKLYCLKRFFPKLLDLLIRLILEPAYPEAELEIQKSLRSQQIKQQLSKNNISANRTFRHLLFGQSAYGTSPEPEDSYKLEPKHLFEFQQKYLTQKPRVYLSGAVDDEALQLVAKALSSLENVSARNIGMKSNKGAAVKTIEKPGSIQSSLRVGSTTIGRNDPDVHQVKIANDLLGGYFGSRLMKNIREEKGLTYGISSSIIHQAQASYWVIGTDVLKEKNQLALAEIEREISNLQTQLVELPELNALKNYLKGKFLSAFDSPFSSASMIKTLVEWKQDVRYWSAYFETIDQINPETIQSTAQKYFRLDTLIKVTVG